MVDPAWHARAAAQTVQRTLARSIQPGPDLAAWSEPSGELVVHQYVTALEDPEVPEIDLALDVARTLAAVEVGDELAIRIWPRVPRHARLPLQLARLDSHDLARTIASCTAAPSVPALARTLERCATERDSARMLLAPWCARHEVRVVSLILRPADIDVILDIVIEDAHGHGEIDRRRWDRAVRDLQRRLRETRDCAFARPCIGGASPAFPLLPDSPTDRTVGQVVSVRRRRSEPVARTVTGRLRDVNGARLVIARDRGDVAIPWGDVAIPWGDVAIPWGDVVTASVRTWP